MLKSIQSKLEYGLGFLVGFVSTFVQIVLDSVQFAFANVLFHLAFRLKAKQFRQRIKDRNGSL